MSDAALARRALACLDLTDLSEKCTDQSIAALCEKAMTPHGPTAAVCIWPQFVSRARSALAGSPVKIATVVNFPAGDDDVERVIDDVQEALGDGAQEIDLVLPYRAVAGGDLDKAAEMVTGVRDVVEHGRALKVILETGELATPALIEAASRIAIEARADFIKTSTGKTAVSATPQAAEIMLAAIKAAGGGTGLKVSGGIRSVADARLYLDLAERMMNPGWVVPRHFRFGASGLYDALIAEIEGRAPTAAAGSY